MSRMRMAVVGCGHLGAIHARLLAGRADVELTAVVDPLAAARDRIAAEHGCRALAEPRELVGIADAAVVAAPTGLHAGVAVPLITAGLDLLVEKPLAGGVEDARAIVIAARRHGRTVAVGHVERFNPAWQATAGRAGRVHFVEATRTAPFTFRSLDVGVVHDLMIHDIDLVLSLEPGRLERIDAQGIVATGGFEDAVRARLVFSSGLVADLTASRISPVAQRTVATWSADAMVFCDLTAKTVRSVSPGASVRSGGFSAASVPVAERAAAKDRFFADVLPCETVIVADANAIACEHDDFLAAIRERRPPLVTAAAGAAAVEIAARVIDALACVRFGRPAAGGTAFATPTTFQRKAG
ncbi:MAG: Gfo/Idh/MocA family oxidoreductase [Planctomycetes bacterium]|nr:Gfo/Idh/MocA family oxidoreductase [Planctomycetota bacterium]